MSLEHLRMAVEDGELVVVDLRGDEQFRGPVEGRPVLSVGEQVDGVAPALLREGDRTLLAAVDVNGLTFWTRPSDGAPFLFLEHPKQPVGVRLADGSQRFYDLETGEPTDAHALHAPGCC